METHFPPSYLPKVQPSCVDKIKVAQILTTLAMAIIAMSAALVMGLSLGGQLPPSAFKIGAGVLGASGGICLLLLIAQAIDSCGDCKPSPKMPQVELEKPTVVEKISLPNSDTPKYLEFGKPVSNPGLCKDVWLRVFRIGGPGVAGKCAQVCRELRKYAQDEKLWEGFLHDAYPRAKLAKHESPRIKLLQVKHVLYKFNYGDGNSATSLDLRSGMTIKREVSEFTIELNKNSQTIVTRPACIENWMVRGDLLFVHVEKILSFAELRIYRLDGTQTTLSQTISIPEIYANFDYRTIKYSSHHSQICLSGNLLYFFYERDQVLYAKVWTSDPDCYLSALDGSAKRPRYDGSDAGKGSTLTKEIREVDGALQQATESGEIAIRVSEGQSEFQPYSTLCLGAMPQIADQKNYLRQAAAFDGGFCCFDNLKNLSVFHHDRKTKTFSKIQVFTLPSSSATPKNPNFTGMMMLYEGQTYMRDSRGLYFRQ